MDFSPTKHIVLIIIFIMLCCGISSAQQDDASIPAIRHRITDGSGSLSSDEMHSLEGMLAQFEQETSNQIVVLMIQSLEGMSLEDFAIRVCEKNKIGKKGKDNGVLLTIAKDDRKMRIDAGYGLEGALPDAICDQIIRKIIAPRFRQDDYYTGIKDGIEAIMLATKGEFKGESSRNSKKIYSLATIILIIVFMFLGGFFGGGRRRYVGSRGAYSSFPWWWGGFGGGSGGGFSSGSFGGGGGFGGFSGGGGSFGGGGASGSW
jgi:uncharacterized protein